MQVTCSACSAKYNIPDERVAGKRARMKCKKCAEPIIIDGRHLGTQAPSPSVSASSVVEAPKTLATKSDQPHPRASQPSFSDETTILGAEQRSALAEESSRTENYRTESKTSPVIKLGEAGRSPAADGLFDDGDVDAAMDSLSHAFGWKPADAIPAKSDDDNDESPLTSESNAPLSEQPNAAQLEQDVPVIVASDVKSELNEQAEHTELTIPARTSSVPPSLNVDYSQGSQNTAPGDLAASSAPNLFSSSPDSDKSGSPQGERESSSGKNEQSLAYAAFDEDSEADSFHPAEQRLPQFSEDKLNESGPSRGLLLPLLLILLFSLLILVAGYVWLEGGDGSLQDRAKNVLKGAENAVPLCLDLVSQFFQP